MSDSVQDLLDRWQSGDQSAAAESEFTPNGGLVGIDLLSVMLHELAHHLGIGHAR